MQNIYIYEYVNGFGFIQGVLLSLVIYFYPGGTRHTNIFLALHVLCFSIVLAAPFSLKLFNQVSPRADRFVEPFLVLIYPFLYLYICSFTEKINPAKIWLHMMPFLIYTPLVIGSLLWANESKDRTHAKFGFDLTLVIFVLIKLFLFSAYLFLCFRKLDSTRRLAGNLFSETSRINLLWVRQLLYAGIGLLVSYLLIMSLIVVNPSLGKLNFLLVGLVTVYLYYCTFWGLSQPAIFIGRFEKKQDSELVNTVTEEIQMIAEDTKREKPKYERSSLPENRQEEMVCQLKEMMEKNRLFLEPELTIQMLGEKLNVSPYYISQVLNQRLKTNFYDFVNQYRVEEAKILLLAPSNGNFTILSIAFDSGFNSKTTFNTVFKKFTAQTPSQFKTRLPA
jgi:AraC-like DNA-binding protein